jgi:hypothetical protein
MACGPGFRRVCLCLFVFEAFCNFEVETICSVVPKLSTDEKCNVATHRNLDEECWPRFHKDATFSMVIRSQMDTLPSPMRHHERYGVRRTEQGRCCRWERADRGVVVEYTVPEARVELARGCPRRILSPLRLPFRHSGAVESSSGSESEAST